MLNNEKSGPGLATIHTLIYLLNTMIKKSLFTGVLYNALKTLNLSEGTREYLERAEFAFGPDPMLISATRLIRNSVYGPTGRILFNAIFSPQETADEFRDMSIKEHVDRALSDSFLR